MSNHFQAPQAMPDETLHATVNTFRVNPRSYSLGTWECMRFSALQAEVTRRSRLRRGRAA